MSDAINKYRQSAHVAVITTALSLMIRSSGYMRVKPQRLSDRSFEE